MMMIETIQYTLARVLVVHWNLIQYLHWVSFTTSSLVKSTCLQRAYSFVPKSQQRTSIFDLPAKSKKLQFLSPPLSTAVEDGALSRCETQTQYLQLYTFSYRFPQNGSFFLLFLLIPSTLTFAHKYTFFDHSNIKKFSYYVHLATTSNFLCIYLLVLNETQCISVLQSLVFGCILERNTKMIAGQVPLQLPTTQIPEITSTCTCLLGLKDVGIRTGSSDNLVTGEM